MLVSALPPAVSNERRGGHLRTALADFCAGRRRPGRAGHLRGSRRLAEPFPAGSQLRCGSDQRARGGAERVDPACEFRPLRCAHDRERHGTSPRTTPDPSGADGRRFLVLNGIGLAWAGLFPASHGPAQADPTLAIPTFPIAFGGAGIGLILVSRRMARDPRWRCFASYVLATGIVTLLLLLVGVTLVQPASAPLHPWLGVFQWVMLLAWCLCTVAVAQRLLHTAHSQRRAHAETLQPGR